MSSLLNRDDYQRNDGYVNATKLCQSAGKLWSNYAQLKSTKEYLDRLSTVLAIPVTGGLVCTTQGGTPSEQGTWVHPEIAIDLAKWISVEYRIMVNRWMVELHTTGHVTIASHDPVSNLKNSYDPERKLSTLPMVCAAMEAAGFGQSAIQLHVVARLKLEGLMEHPSLVPPVEAMAPIASPKAFLKPTEIAAELGWLYKTGTPNSRSVNAALESLGYQRKIGRHWEATDKGASLCERRPVVVANKKADVDQLLWRSDIVAVLREQF